MADLLKTLSALLIIFAFAAGCADRKPTELKALSVASADQPQTDAEVAPSAPSDDQAPPQADGSMGKKSLQLKTYRFGLDQAIEWALKNNLSLMNARDQVARSKFNVEAAAAAFEVKIVPKGSATVSGGDTGTDVDRGVGLGATKRTVYGTSVGVSADTSKTAGNYTTAVDFDLTQPLLRGFGREVNKNSLLSAQYNQLSTERMFVEYQENLVLSVVRNFYEIIRQREVLALNEKSAERTRKHVEAAKARERVGLASRIDVLRAEIQVRQAEDALLSARQAYGDAVDRLKILLGFNPQYDLDIDADLSFKFMDVAPEMAVGVAFENRLDLARAADDIEEAERASRVAKNNTLPQLDLVFGYQQYGTGQSFSDSSDFRSSSWNVGLATSTDLFRTAERARYQQSKYDVDATKRNYLLLKDTVVREVKDAIRRLEKNRKRIEIQKTELEQAQQKQKLAQMKFERGLADNFDLITAEEEIIRAQTNHIAAVTDYIVSQAELKKTIGTLIEKPDRLLH